MHQTAALIEWTTDQGTTRWLQGQSAWVGMYESWRRRQGNYASAKGAMMAWCAGGRVTVFVGPRRERVELAAGDALLIEARTPFSFQMSAARMLVTELKDPSPGIGLRRISQRALPKEVSEWLDECWAHPAAVLQASEMGERTRECAGTVVPFAHAHNTARMLAVKEYLEHCFTEPLRLEKVARNFKLDPFYLSRAFSQTAGIAPKAFLQALRLEHFLRALLAHPERSMTRAAFEAGVPDYPAFCRLVKVRLGRPPSSLLRHHPLDQVFPSARRPQSVACRA